MCTARGSTTRELLLARPAPLHRPPGLQREQRADRVGRRVDLAAETAADRPADELELVQRHLEVRRDNAHREVHRLRARIDRQPAVGLGHGDADLRLHRHLLDRLRPVHALNDRVRLVERPVDIALANAAVVVRAVVRIDVAPLMDLRSLRVERQPHVEQRLALLELNLDRLDRGLRGLLRLGGDDGDRLALVADVVLREQRLVGGDAETFEVAVDVLGHVGVRDHGVHALHRLRLRGVEPRDGGMVVRRAERLRPERLADANVVDEARPPRDVRDAVVTREACADGLHAGLPSRDASMTASTIFT
jgi:hypothetical protein